MCLEGTDFTFDEDECLQSVLEDLRYYWSTFKSYRDPDRILEQSVLRSIENLMQDCFSAMLLDGAQVQVKQSTQSEINIYIYSYLLTILFINHPTPCFIPYIVFLHGNISNKYKLMLRFALQISVHNENSFERRLKLCKVLKGFQIRTITINRVLNHIVSSSQI
ncbi:uncharacterized protein zmp:0000001127 isoform X1 [Ictalurus furcatus]|uniref:uncharacterized protein zmp:0000001127 isoform X1 n=1 Tax=Ictalurus furcatus TaxID=66913 RepID=UPI0023509B95|nr:uncharacterized protein zmp:0000001127 isoform X1 [Ictalurus furcatus]